jgi:hypothetical protein
LNASYNGCNGFGSYDPLDGAAICGPIERVSPPHSPGIESPVRHCLHTWNLSAACLTGTGAGCQKSLTTELNCNFVKSKTEERTRGNMNPWVLARWCCCFLRPTKEAYGSIPLQGFFFFVGETAAPRAAAHAFPAAPRVDGPAIAGNPVAAVIAWQLTMRPLRLRLPSEKKEKENGEESWGLFFRVDSRDRRDS